MAEAVALAWFKTHSLGLVVVLKLSMRIHHTAEKAVPAIVKLGRLTTPVTVRLMTNWPLTESNRLAEESVALAGADPVSVTVVPDTLLAVAVHRCEKPGQAD